MPDRRWIVVALCVGWVAAIYLTSSTVITPHEFFGWFHEHVFTSDAAFQKFQTFWGLSWLVIVKGWHVTEFAVLMLLGTWSLDALTGVSTRKNVLIAALFCIGYAGTDEWHQTYVPNRGGVVSDVLIDSLGVLAMGLCLSRQRCRRNGGG